MGGGEGGGSPGPGVRLTPPGSLTWKMTVLFGFVYGSNSDQRKKRIFRKSSGQRPESLAAARKSSFPWQGFTRPSDAQTVMVQ